MGCAGPLTPVVVFIVPPYSTADCLVTAMTIAAKTLGAKAEIGLSQRQVNAVAGSIGISGIK